MSSLYILEIKPLSEVSPANVFPYGCFSFHFIDVQKHFILMRSHLFILSFMSLALGDILVKILLHRIYEIYPAMFSLGLLWCHDLCLGLLFTLNLFLCWYNLVVDFHFSACSCLALPTPFIEEAVFTPFYASVPFVKY